MDQLASLLAYVLSGVGLTALIIWPDEGPMALARDQWLRPRLPQGFEGVLDCYICSGFWVGLGLSLLWWLLTRETWCWAGCLMIPGVFWMWLTPRPPPTDSSTN